MKPIMTQGKQSDGREPRPTRQKPRRRLHREFLRWLRLNRARFAIGIAPGKRTDKALEFCFVGINPAITGILSTRDVNVNVMFEDADFDDGNWDTLIWLFHGAKPVPGGYICSQCKPEYKRVFPDLVALWTDHLFEELLKWVNEDLAPANWLVLNDTVKAFNSAWITPLHSDAPGPPDCVHTALPLRTQPRKQIDPSPSAALRPLNLADPTDELGSPPRSLP
jgi:hypothetical protein